MTNIIGRIEERWRHPDICLCQVSSDIEFSNLTYFDSPSPRQFVLSDHVERSEGWCWIDTACASAVPFLKTWFSITLSGNRRVKYHELKHHRACNFLAFGSVDGDLLEGVLVQRVDNLIHAGWKVFVKMFPEYLNQGVIAINNVYQRENFDFLGELSE